MSTRTRKLPFMLNFYLLDDWAGCNLGLEMFRVVCRFDNSAGNDRFLLCGRSRGLYQGLCPIALDVSLGREYV